MTAEIAATIAPTSVRSRRSRRICSTEWRRSKRSTSSPPGWPRDRSLADTCAIERRGSATAAGRCGRSGWRWRRRSSAGPRSRGRWPALITAGTDAAKHGVGLLLVGDARGDEGGDGVERPAHRARLGRDADRGDVAGSAASDSRTRRVLPMPASPETRATVGLVTGHHGGGVDENRRDGRRDAGPPDHHRAHPQRPDEHGRSTVRQLNDRRVVRIRRHGGRGPAGAPPGRKWIDEGGTLVRPMAPRRRAAPRARSPPGRSCPDQVRSAPLSTASSDGDS